MLEQIKQPVVDDFSAVNALIIEQLHSDVPLVENIGHYIVDAGGKRLRPLITLLAAKAGGYQGQQHIELATIIEFIHTATLLHDDVVDISELRRGRPTANANWGNAPSVLVGDFLYSRAFQMLVALENLTVMANLADTTNRIAEGEVQQLVNAGDPSTTEANYMEVIKGKTAVLFEAATYCAGVLSGAEPTTAKALGDYGLHLGVAFQIADDMLDYLGNPEEMGKNLGDDLAEGKPTLPLIYTITNGSKEAQDLTINAIKNKDKSQLNAIIQAVQTCGALDYTKDQAIKASDQAISALAPLSDSPYKSSLEKVAHLAVSRQS